MKIYPIDKCVRTNTFYEAEDNVVYIIRKVGTTYAYWAELYIDGKKCLGFFGCCGPLIRDKWNNRSLFDLGDLYIVILPKSKFYFQMYYNYWVRIKGEVIILKPWEKPFHHHLKRYQEQFKKFYDLFYYNLYENRTLYPKDEMLLTEFVVPPNQKAILNSYLITYLVLNGAGDFDLQLRIYKNEKQVLDNLNKEKLPAGLTWYDKDAYTIIAGEEEFKLDKRPIILEPEDVLKFTIVNTSNTIKTGTFDCSIGFQYIKEILN